MGKRKSPKQRVTEYYMSVHFGICQGPVDNLNRIRINEKTAWTGYQTQNSSFIIENKELFGGVKKEGGVAGRVHWRKGDYTQTMPEKLAGKLGLTASNAPGYRGLAHAFFTDFDAAPDSGDAVLGINGVLGIVLSTFVPSSSGMPGFYWSANQPYVPPVDFQVTRIADDWFPETATIPGTPSYPLAVSITIDDSGSMAEGDKLATMKSAMNLALDRIQNAIAFNGLKIDLHIAKWAGSLTEISFANATSANINTCKNFINGFTGNSGGTEFDRAAGNTFMTSTLAKDLGDRVWIFMTDGEPTGGSETTAVSIAADMLDKTSGAFSGATAVNCYGVNIENTSTTSTALLDNTPLDGVPVIAPDDPTGLLNVIQRAIFGGTPPDVNPAHIIHEVLTNAKYGMGAPISQIDDAAFRIAAETLFQEGFGMSMIWVEQIEIENFVQEVLDHIEATLYVDPATGLFVLKLIRDDYVAANLPIFDEDNSTVSSYSRRSPAEIINEINVTWTNPNNEKEEVITIQDLGGIVQSGGQIISDNRNYYGIRRKDLAWQVAQRDISAVTARLSTVQIDIDRRAWDMVPGGVFKLTSAEHGVSEEIMRVVKVDYGKPGDSTVTVNGTQDIFSFERPQYEIPPDGEFDGDGKEPEVFSSVRVFTLNYFLTGYYITADSLVTADYPDVYVAVAASTENTDAIDVELVGEVSDPAGNVLQEPLGTRSVIARGLLADAFSEEAVTLTVGFTDLTKGQGPTQGGFGLIADPGTAEDDAELVMFTQYDGVNYTVTRGILDTTPRVWPVGTQIHFFGSQVAFSDQEVRSAFEPLIYKVLMRTSLGGFSQTNAPEINYTTNERPHLPTRPANVEMAGQAWTDVDGRLLASVPVTWANRNRLTEDSQVMSWTDPGIAPELGQTTKITIRDQLTNVIEIEITGITGESYEIPRASFGGLSRAIVRVTAERDGFESFQGYEQNIQLASGYGYGYGLSYGG